MRLCTALLLLVPLAGCDNAVDSAPGAPASVAVAGGDAQVGTAGQPLPQPVVARVVDARGRAVPGQAVNFVAVLGGGSVAVATVTSDAEGRAGTIWTLGPAAGAPQTLEARVAGAGGATLVGTFTATASAGAPARLVAVSDTIDLNGAVGGPARDTLAVRVLDALGNRVPGVDVNWAATEGGGGTTPARSTTDNAGIARAVWTLGPRTDLVQGAVASVPGAGTAAFYARAGHTLTPVQGHGITASGGVPIAVSVRFTGDAGAVQSARVEWTVMSGGGSVAPSTTLTQTGANAGTASTSWTLGTTAGTQTLRARVGPVETIISVTAIGVGSRTLLAQVPGRVMDADAQRVLWVDSTASHRRVMLRSVSTGTDVRVKEDTAGRPPTLNGHLFTGGALLWPLNQGQGSENNTLFEYRGGALTLLGTTYSGVSVRDDWAAWRSGTDLLRRDLAGGATAVIRGSGSLMAVGETGDVTFHEDGSLYLYRNGAVTTVTPDATPVMTMLSDGVNVVYFVYVTWQSSASLWLDRPGGDLMLAAHSTKSGGIVYWDMRNGWIAYSTGLSPTMRRRPDGTIEQLSPEQSATRFQALAADGTVIYQYPTPTGRYFMVLPDGTRLDMGPVGNERIVWRRGGFLLISSDGAVYRLAP